MGTGWYAAESGRWWWAPGRLLSWSGGNYCHGLCGLSLGLCVTQSLSCLLLYEL